MYVLAEPLEILRVQFSNRNGRRYSKGAKMQGVEDEDEGAYLKYVTETEFRKQRSSLCIF